MNLYLCIGFGWLPQTSNTSFFFPPVKMVLEVKVTGKMVVEQQNLLHRICFSFCWFFLVTQQNDTYVCVFVYLLIIKQVTNKNCGLAMYNADTTPIQRRSPRRYVYTSPYTNIWHIARCNTPIPVKGCDYYTSRGHLPLQCSRQHLKVAKFRFVKNKASSKRLYIMS